VNKRLDIDLGFPSNASRETVLVIARKRGPFRGAVKRLESLLRRLRGWQNLLEKGSFSLDTLAADAEARWVSYPMFRLSRISISGLQALSASCPRLSAPSTQDVALSQVKQSSNIVESYLCSPLFNECPGRSRYPWFFGSRDCRTFTPTPIGFGLSRPFTVITAVAIASRGTEINRKRGWRQNGDKWRQLSSNCMKKG